MNDWDDDTMARARTRFALTGEAAPRCAFMAYRFLMAASALAGLAIFIVEVERHWLASLMLGAGVSLGGCSLALILCETLIVTGVLREAWLSSRSDPAALPWGHFMTETRLDFTDLPRWRLRRPSA